ncbi:MAG: type I-C CRISPR-associated protein Cas8c/Csd1 [Desulfovibrio sp.]|jgi:CRISPR-associated protein Csd1|nr:type I-C CRISPR-associated protein Cas8c/Csd1 [Desulfovibrio sp.]
MILHALYSYHQRLSELHPDMPMEGFAPQPVHFALRLNNDGELMDVVDLREKASKGKKMLPRKMVLPSLGESKGSGIKPNFLWENARYVLGRDNKGKPQRTAKCREAFLALHEKLLGEADVPEAKALLRFLHNPPTLHPEIEKRWPEMETANLVFELGQRYLHDIQDFKDIWQNHGENGASTGICLVTGEHANITQLHPFIKGIAGTNSGGAALSSYNQKAFESFDKEQNYNAPVSRRVAFAYTSAINYLIRQKEQSLRLGESTVICWAEKACGLETSLFALFGGSTADPGNKSDKEADVTSAALRAGWLRKIGQGFPVTDIWPDFDPSVQMHVLALAPNNSRLSVSFYLHGPAREFLDHILDYYGNLKVVRRFDDEPEFPSVWQLARAVLGQHKKESDIRRLGGDLLSAALSGLRYPAYFLPMCLQRLRSGDAFRSVHAGLIKAMLIRNYNQEASMSLNPQHPSPSYQLGRLFALLVGLQRKAIGPNINADIRDKYYGSASATPSVVFPLLLRGAQNHISKTDAYGYDKLIREVLERINDSFPAHLNLEEQGLFALGYYHQRADKAIKQAEDAVSDVN